MIVEASFFDKMFKVRKNAEPTQVKPSVDANVPEIEIGDDFDQIPDRQSGLSRRNFIKAAFGTGVTLGLGNMMFGDEVILNFKESVEAVSDREFDAFWGKGFTRDIVMINGRRHTILVPNPAVDRLLEAYNAVLDAEKSGNSIDYDEIVEQFCFRLADYVQWKSGQIEEAGFDPYGGDDVDVDGYDVSGYREEELKSALKDYYEYYGPNYD